MSWVFIPSLLSYPRHSNRFEKLTLSDGRRAASCWSYEFKGREKRNPWCCPAPVSLCWWGGKWMPWMSHSLQLGPRRGFRWLVQRDYSFRVAHARKDILSYLANSENIMCSRWLIRGSLTLARCLPGGWPSCACRESHTITHLSSHCRILSQTSKQEIKGKLQPRW